MKLDYARRAAPAAGRRPAADARKRAARKKFLSFYPGGFADEDYIALERDYKWQAHLRWSSELGREAFERRLASRDHAAIAQTAVQIESRTNLLFSFEKMAVRDAVRSSDGARMFAQGLYDWLHGEGSEAERFERWCETVAELPRRQTRVLTWPVATVFGFIANPRTHFFVKPVVTRTAAAAYGVDLPYKPRPSWDVYDGILGFARLVRRDVADLRPRDMIDVQSFIWVQGSDEYEG